jgi:hypothetical protein
VPTRRASELRVSAPTPFVITSNHFTMSVMFALLQRAIAAHTVNIAASAAIPASTGGAAIPPRKKLY